MTMEPGKKARLTAALVLLMVLGTGMVLGVALERRLEARSVQEYSSGATAGQPPDTQGRSRGYDPRSRDRLREPGEERDSLQRRPRLIVDQVGLSDQQKEQVDSIVGHFRSRMRALHDEFDQIYATRYREITEATREEIKKILTADQQAAYDSLLTEWDHRRDRRQDSVPGAGRGR